MKIKNGLSIAIFSFAIGILITSCGITNKNDFASRKYTNFRKGDVQVELKTAQVQNQINLSEKSIITENNLQPTTSEINNTVNTAEEIVRNTTTESTPIAVSKSKNNTTKKNTVINLKKSNLTEKTNVNREVKINKATRYLLSRISDQPNTTELNTDQLILVILAIIIPPLAVFIARGLGNEFWISLILTLLFWLPGMIYALLIVLDVI